MEVVSSSYYECHKFVAQKSLLIMKLTGLPNYTPSEKNDNYKQQAFLYLLVDLNIDNVTKCKQKRL